MIDIWNEPIVHFNEKGIPVSNASLAEMYREVKTPQSPECRHDWEDGYSMNGPTKTCRKCRKFMRD